MNCFLRAGPTVFITFGSENRLAAFWQKDFQKHLRPIRIGLGIVHLNREH